ncbi:A/G-specific adenine glycosylase [Polycyclovorans algicola]|uniref:A/G-specific adenine glycosylase n=1 Tax=Polycyclovorans algicola TaxID=616992 RepID=UPI000694537F|nr:A/G-specific adenine glycosylase [Polycyclovorans algicola]
MSAKPFAERVLQWFDAHGRHDLPWQRPRSAYRVWVSEIMLQQTQVATVIPYFTRFMARFPDVATLAAAPLDDVLAHWSGLGYYARARNLHACAQGVANGLGGEFPRTVEGCLALPGIGRSTAGAIVSQAFDARAPILDGNVRRVLARHAALHGWPGTPAVSKAFWALAESRLPEARYADYTQALMDLGATCCTARRPQCLLCPVQEDCLARQQGSVASLPTPKPRRARPRKQAQVLVVENHDGEILLARRPQRGIWGGLWSLPVIMAGDAWPSGLDALQPFDNTPLTPIAHSFTHFDLQMDPVHLQGQPAVNDDLIWHAPTQALTLGLPAPIRRMIEQRVAHTAATTTPEAS